MLPCAVAYCPLSHILEPAELNELRSSAEKVSSQTGRQQEALLARQFRTTADSVPRGQMEYLFDTGNWSPYFTSEPGKRYASLLQMLQYPFARGSIHIPSRKEKGNRDKVTVDDKPIIDPRYYLGAGEIDRKVMVAAQRFGDSICRTEPLARIIKRRVCPPETTGTESEVDTYEKFVKDHSITNWHRKCPSPSRSIYLHMK